MTVENQIKIRGARVHNLKNVDVDIPKNKLVVVTGISGSGKSSLAFDTLYAEGQRRYVESLSPYARQFLGVMDKPDVDKIEGISPAISIDQRKASHNPRSTVGTITEIYDYLRLLFARIGKPHCPKCGKLVSRQTIDQITDQVLKLPKTSEITILGPVVRGKKGEHRGILEEIQKGGFVRVRLDNIVYTLEEVLEKVIDKQKKHSIEVVVDRLVLDKDLDKSRLVDSLETALKLGKGIVMVSQKKGKGFSDSTFSELFACEECGISMPELEPRLFSFNSPFGACPECHGLGEKLEIDPKLVIPNGNLTLGEGAIFPWARASHKIGRQGYFWWKMKEFAEENSIDLDVPVKELPKEKMKLLLYGKGDFEGVIPSLERRYHETDSDWTRQEIEQYMVVKKCEKCGGRRLKPEVLAVKVKEKSIDQVVSMQIDKTEEFFSKSFDSKNKITYPIVKEILSRLRFLKDVGLDYLSLDRKSSSLSGGESQRIKITRELSKNKHGHTVYMLDEPTTGLHFDDTKRLIKVLNRLVEKGNTVFIIEHNLDVVKSCDYLLDLGPEGGNAGGELIAIGTPEEIVKIQKSYTGKFLKRMLANK